MVISNSVTFEYKASKEERRKEEMRNEEKSLETGLLARLEALGLCKAEDREKLEEARSCSQVSLTHFEFLAGSPYEGIFLIGTSNKHDLNPRRNGKSLLWSSAKD